MYAEFICHVLPPDNTTHPIKLDGTYGPNVPSNLTGMRKFPYHGYTTCIMAVFLYRAYHGTPQMCGGMKNTPNTFLDVTCDKVTAKGRGARQQWLWYHAYHGWPYGSAPPSTALGRHNRRRPTPAIRNIKEIPCIPRAYAFATKNRRTWGVEIPHVPQMCGGDAVPPSAGTLGGARTMGTM
ncbi:hypothetical protein C8J57DRAFT_1252781 [Mycena rebaudengoi]|nr:hypothetical protein C8J57DRAFT_1252781 [Mycena rebaudengoi]